MIISIVTPSYNSSQFIEATIESVRNQSYSNYEHIIVDGGSTDNTVSILKRYPELRWGSEPDQGQSDAINKGFRQATGDILAWQNADDLYCHYTFDVVIDFFKSHPDVDLVYGNYEVIDESGRILYQVAPREWNQWYFAHGRFVPLQPTVFWRRRLYEDIGELDINLNYCMDVDFFARASKRFSFRRIPVMLGQFRVHSSSKTHNSLNRQRIYEEHKRVLSKQYGYNFFDYLLFDFFYYRGRAAEAFLSRAGAGIHQSMRSTNAPIRHYRQ